jgi:hypothetical protein
MVRDVHKLDFMLAVNDAFNKEQPVEIGSYI